MSPSDLTTARWHLLQGNTPLPWSAEVTASLVSLIGDTLGFPAPGTPEEELLPIAALPPSGFAPRIALCLGHARAGDQGSLGAAGVSEEEYNSALIPKVQGRLAKRGIDAFIVDFYQGNGYETAMRWLARHLRDRGATAAVEFHYNASGDGRARGHEMLHWGRSRKGITLAKSILDALDRAFPEQPSRGLKPKNPRDRGALFLSLTHCPATIAEPFFGDNPSDWQKFDDIDEIERLADAYADGIAAWVQSHP